MLSTPQAILESRDIEVHKQSCRMSRQFQVSNQLSEMDRVISFDCLYLDDNAILHKQVQLKRATERRAFVQEWHLLFTLGMQALLPQFDQQTFAIYAF